MKKNIKFRLEKFKRDYVIGINQQSTKPLIRLNSHITAGAKEVILLTSSEVDNYSYKNCCPYWVNEGIFGRKRSHYFKHISCTTNNAAPND
jgi:glyceraldehyde-3-phosphate dehydrogenase/erythrose-4-phosphate dehydrogenase